MNGNNSRGFTLIEIIIAIVFFSIMTVMILVFTSTNISPSVSPVINLIRAGDVQTGIDNVTRAYYNLTNPVSHADLVNFRNGLNPGVTGVTVDASRTDFITFPAAGGNEGPDPGATAPNLKVTLTNSQGQRLSTIFTTRY